MCLPQENSTLLSAHLARLLALGVEGHLLDGQLATRVGVVAQVHLSKSPPAQQLPQPPVCWSTRSYNEKKKMLSYRSQGGFSRVYWKIIQTYLQVLKRIK